MQQPFRPARTGRVDLARARQPVQAPSRGQPPGVDDPALVAAALAQRNASIAADSAALIARGRSSVLDLNGVVDNAIGLTDVLRFTVPSNAVAIVSRMVVVYSEPFVSDLARVSLVIGASKIGYMSGQAAYGLVVGGSLAEPWELSEIYVSAGEDIVVSLINGPNTRYRCSARLVGELIQPRVGGV